LIEKGQQQGRAEAVYVEQAAGFALIGQLAPNMGVFFGQE
jgi:hypothetical protein